MTDVAANPGLFLGQSKLPRHCFHRIAILRLHHHVEQGKHGKSSREAAICPLYREFMIIKQDFRA